jgi:hypothetical protein
VLFAIIRKKKLCRASKKRGKVGLITENKFQNCGRKTKMIFKPKMTNYAEMITKWLQLAMKLVKVAKNWLVSQIFVRNRQENFLKIVYATDGQNERSFL